MPDGLSVATASSRNPRSRHRREAHLTQRRLAGIASNRAGAIISRQDSHRPYVPRSNFSIAPSTSLRAFSSCSPVDLPSPRHATTWLESSCAGTRSLIFDDPEVDQLLDQLGTFIQEQGSVFFEVRVIGHELRIPRWIWVPTIDKLVRRGGSGRSLQSRDLSPIVSVRARPFLHRAHDAR
jgi:hypothetical protein